MPTPVWSDGIIDTLAWGIPALLVLWVVVRGTREARAPAQGTV